MEHSLGSRLGLVRALVLVAPVLVLLLLGGARPVHASRVARASVGNGVSNNATRALGKAASASKTASGGGGGAHYTTNSVCLQHNCINPIVPGLMQFGQSVLQRNDDRTWTCSQHPDEWKLTGICSRVVAGYHFSLPDPEETDMTVGENPILGQARQALTAYVAHLSGMGYDFWDYRDPWNHDACIQAVWKMACWTHFPRCNQLEEGRYLRPCASSCQNYLNHCRVQCCDEGVQCVFRHNRQMADGSSVVEEGYADHHGPSPMCTGAAAPAANLLGASVIAFLAFVFLYD